MYPLPCRLARQDNLQKWKLCYPYRLLQSNDVTTVCNLVVKLFEEFVATGDDPCRGRGIQPVGYSISIATVGMKVLE